MNYNDVSAQAEKLRQLDPIGIPNQPVEASLRDATVGRRMPLAEQPGAVSGIMEPIDESGFAGRKPRTRQQITWPGRVDVVSEPGLVNGEY